MDLGVFSPILHEKSLEEMLAYLSSLGVSALELGVGGFPGTAHCDAKKAVSDPAAPGRIKALLEKYGVRLSALSVHGNPVHPDEKKAKAFRDDFEAACKLAGMLGVDRVVTFSGCPGGSPGAKEPNWVTCAWPDDFSRILKYQWDDVLVPYWKDAAKLAGKNGVKYICLELHPGFMVYNPETLLRLRKAVGVSAGCAEIGANFDPSHLFWQGIDPVSAITALRGTIFHFHAKDTKILAPSEINGVLDTKSFSDIAGRSWLFRTAGYGHGADVWRDIVSALQTAGYDGAISIEHEDALMQPLEGLEKAIGFLRPLLIAGPPQEGLFWA